MLSVGDVLWVVSLVPCWCALGGQGHARASLGNVSLLMREQNPNMVYLVKKKSGFQVGCVAIVALLRDLAADHSTPEQRVTVNATCPMQDMSFEMELWKMW